MHPAPGDHRRDDLRVEVVPRITVEHDQIRIAARDQRAAAALPALASHAGATHVAWNACSTVTACSRMPRRLLVDRPSDPRSDALQAGRSSSIGASDPLATTAPESHQRAVGCVRAGGLVAQYRSARVRSGRGDARTAPMRPPRAGRSGGDRRVRLAERARSDGEARAARPDAARLLERVERLPVRAIADRMHRDGQLCRDAAPSTQSRRSSSPLVICTPLPSSSQAVCEPSIAVHEHLQIAEREHRVAEPGSDAELAERSRPARRGIELPHPQRQRWLPANMLP